LQGTAISIMAYYGRGAEDTVEEWLWALWSYLWVRQYPQTYQRIV